MVAAIIVAMTTKVAIIVRAELDIVYAKMENLAKVILKSFNCKYVLYKLLVHKNNKFAEKQSEGVRFLLIRHSEYSVIYCQKCTPTDCFFGDFTHCFSVILPTGFFKPNTR